MCLSWSPFSGSANFREADRDISYRPSHVLWEEQDLYQDCDCFVAHYSSSENSAGPVRIPTVAVFSLFHAVVSAGRPAWW